MDMTQCDTIGQLLACRVIHNQLTSHDLQKRKVSSDFALIRHFKHIYDLYSKSGSDKLKILLMYSQQVVQKQCSVANGIQNDYIVRF